MGAAVALGNVVGIAKYCFLVRVVPLQRQFNRDAVALSLHIKGCWVQSVLFAVEMLDEGGNATFVFEHILGSGALVN